MRSPQEHISNIEVLYDGGEEWFSLAKIVWDGDDKCIGLRWNGTDDKPNEYPSSRGCPQWMVVNDEVIKAITSYKLGLFPNYNSNTNDEEDTQ